MMRFLRLLAWSFITAAIVIAGLGGAGYWLYRDAERSGPLAAAHTIIIPAHRGLAAISELLEHEGVIRHKLMFEVIAKLSGRGGALKPGEYEIPATASAMQTLNLLASGNTVKHRLTIPEGLTTPEVLELVRKAPAMDGDTGPAPPEGELLPDTYVYSYGETRHGMIERMRHAMAHVVTDLWRDRRPDLPFATRQQAVILASIIEKETAGEEERAHVAGVFINRLRLGMPLQADPTVLFALSDNGANKIDRPLTHADLAVSSPYNTYIVKHLPPGPIDNPSRSSLRAAMRPEHTEDLYFVADGTGGHVFAKTLAEQSRNIAQYHHGAGLEPEAPPPPAPSAVAVKPTGGAEPEKAHPHPKNATGASHHAVRTAQQAAHVQHCRIAGRRGCPR
jgi:UPF0755 protein